MSGLKDSPSYSLAFKDKVISEVRSGRLTKEQARLKFGIGGKSTILKWMRKLDSSYKAESFIVDKKDREVYEDRIKQLEKQLELERLKRVAAETIIDIAEKQLKIKIRKKSNTKQSKK